MLIWLVQRSQLLTLINSVAVELLCLCACELGSKVTLIANNDRHTLP